MYSCFRLKRLLSAVSALLVLIGAGFALIPVFAENSPEPPVSLPVIMYHSVCEKEPSAYTVTPAQLESDLAWLRDHGCKTVTAEQLIDYTSGIGQLPEKPVLITFDDGFYNNLSLALPLLEKYDMTALVSIVGRYTDDYAAADPHADSYSYLIWEDVSALLASGRIEIGSHTYDLHSDTVRKGCARLPDETVEDYSAMLAADVGLLSTELHLNCGVSPVVFAYPFGSLCPESLPVLRDSGILMTLTCREGMNLITRDPDCLYGIFRYNRSGLLTTEEYMEQLTQ
ncbi:polysaccharide deacetylase family protein [Ruminococcus sp.]|uniref:polysaccharide deacetylase family protein n=1 Tax=Ruminococcus sp. TaxID=41978 RepID=UPI002C9B1142|nr:polysaccharide deacetylase family protein [Ruminococcus sp.]HNZ98659.1 polysaccharide deacetylase family protein [Ruminococcus sp.]HOH86931.1 polysaccharide deacetylase family protein [Ruminococcus sp.]